MQNYKEVVQSKIFMKKFLNKMTYYFPENLAKNDDFYLKPKNIIKGITRNSGPECPLSCIQ